MKLYASSFQLLDDNVWVYSSWDGSDSVIYDKGFVDLASAFFDVHSAANEFIYNAWISKILQLFEFDQNQYKISFCGRLVTASVLYYNILDWAVYNGYYLVMFSIAEEDHLRSGYYLGVASMKDNHFVGSISSVYDCESSDELVRLIISTPEIKWSV